MKCPISEQRQKLLLEESQKIINIHNKKYPSEDYLLGEKSVFVKSMVNSGFVFLDRGGSRYVFGIPESNEVVLKFDPYSRSNKEDWGWYWRRKPRNRRYFSKLYSHSENFNVLLCERLHTLNFDSIEKFIECENRMKKLAKRKKWALEDIYVDNIMWRKDSTGRKTLVFCDFEH